MKPSTRGRRFVGYPTDSMIAVLPTPEAAAAAAAAIRLGQRAGRVGQAAIAIGIGQGPGSPNHLGPHNALEWVVYLGLFAVIAAVVIYEWRSRNVLPDLPEPRRPKARRRQAPTSGSPETRPDQSFDEPAPRHDES